MELTKNFALEEVIRTDTGLINNPGPLETERLLLLCVYILQPWRNAVGKLKTNSGFRTNEVNIAVGGSPTSQHKEGGAADILPLEVTLEDAFTWARENLIFGQLIIEEKRGKKWIHISLPRIAKQNMMVMKMKDGVYTNI